MRSTAAHHWMALLHRITGCARAPAAIDARRTTGAPPGAAIARRRSQLPPPPPLTPPPRRAPSAEGPATPAGEEVDFGKITIAEALGLLNAKTHGLTENEAAKRLDEYGPNKLPETSINPFVRCGRGGRLCRV